MTVCNFYSHIPWFMLIKRLNIFLIFCTIACFGCSTGRQLVPQEQKSQVETKIAVLPFQVEINLRKSNRQVFTDEQVAELQLYFTNSLQEYMIYRLQKKAAQDHSMLSFLSADKINHLINNNNITYGRLFTMKKTEIIQILSVDEIIFSKAVFGQPFSDDVSDAGFFFAGLNLPSNDLTLKTGLYEKSSDSAVWKNNITKELSFMGQPFGDFRYVKVPLNKYQQVINPMMSNVGPAIKEFAKKFMKRRQVKT